LKSQKIYQEDYRKSPNEFYYKLRDDEEFSQSKDCVIRAARVICLNRTGFNGLHRVNNQGKFNVPLGSYKNPTICDSDNLRKVSLSLRQYEAKINAGDYRDLLLNRVRKDDFIYLDPPYNPTSRTARFTGYTKGGFKYKDQEELANIFKKLDKRGCKILLSNSDTPFVRELYSDYANYTIEFDVVRCINSKGDRRSGHKELLIRNYPR
jgi:DNA adenine methylase